MYPGQIKKMLHFMKCNIFSCIGKILMQGYLCNPFFLKSVGVIPVTFLNMR